MLTYCVYQGCTSKNVPFSNITFFTLPRDERRQIWIENSGNSQLKNIGPNSVRYFCEKHFDPSMLRRQFTRTILHRTAVPYKYENKPIIKQIPEEEEVHESFNENDEDVYGTVQTLQSELAAAGVEVLDITSETIDTHQVRECAEDVEQVDDDNDEQDDDDDNGEQEKDGDEEDGRNLLDEYSGIEYISVEDIYKKDNDFEMDNDPESNYECDKNDGQEVQVEVIIDERPKTYLKRIRTDTKPSENEPALKKVMNGTNKRKSSDSVNCNRTEQSGSMSTSNFDYEEDKHFALSLVGYFQRLPMKKRIMAKSKILQYLTELQYDDTAHL